MLKGAELILPFQRLLLSFLHLYPSQLQNFIQKISFKGFLGGSVKSPVFGFCSGHDLMVHEFRSMSGSALIVQSLLGILSPSVAYLPRAL